MAHWTEEEAIAFGLRKGPDGNWYPGRNLGSALRVRDAHPGGGPERSDKKLAKREAKNEKRRQEIGKAGTFQIHVTYYRERYLDTDNVYPKYYIDELVRHKIIPDDSSKYIDLVTKKVTKINPGEEERVHIAVYKRRS